LLALLLSACAVPVRADKIDYVGEWWSSEGMWLLITRDGSIAYSRMKKGGRVSIEGPLKGFTGDDFEVGFGPAVTTFKVSKPPHQVDNRWLMTVDGVELTRQ
jgi:hypothetical protein